MADVRKGNGEDTAFLRIDGEEIPVQVHDGIVTVSKAFGGMLVMLVRRPKAKAARSRFQKTVVNLSGMKGVPGYGTDAVTRRLVDALGSNATAALLGVSRDRPGRWISGDDQPNEVNRAQLADLDSLVGHLMSAFTPEQARLWLEGQNPHLGARPIDVFRMRGAAPVIEAIQAHEQGTFA